MIRDAIRKVRQWPNTPWYKTRVVYAPPILAIGLILGTSIPFGKITAFQAGCIGFNVGLLFMHFNKRIDDRFREDMDRLKEMDQKIRLKIMEAEIRAQVKKEYEAGWKTKP